MKTTLVIADDHEILRDGLATYATDRAGMALLASVGDAQSAINACARLQPTLLVMDIEMPGRDPLAAVADVRSVSADTKVVILSAFCRDAMIEQALRQGVDGYLLKADRPVLLFENLARAVGGARVYSKGVEDRIQERAARAGGDQSRLSGLTPREREVLQYIALGRDNEQMAREMSLSKRTVERHVARLMDSIAIRGRGALMKFAHEHGLA